MGRNTETEILDCSVTWIYHWALRATDSPDMSGAGQDQREGSVSGPRSSPFSCPRISLPSCLISSRRFCRSCFMPEKRKQFLPQQISLATTCVELQYPKCVWWSMRSAPRFSLTILRKGRGQDGDLLFLQLSDFILQLDNSLPNCPDLGRVTERAEGDTKVLQTALLPASSRPLENSGRDPSLIPSGRTHRPGSPAVPCPGVPPARPAPCPHRPSCHPPARAEGSWASLPCCGSLPAGLTGFRVFPS